MRSAKGFVVVVLMIAVAAIAYFVWKHKQEVMQEERTQQASAAEEKRIRGLVNEMALQWNAITDWDGSFDRSRTKPIFTVELEKAIVGPRPILIWDASVDDVKRTNGAYTVQLSSTVGDATIRFSLFCTEELAQGFLRGPEGTALEFAVVASIDHVEKGRPEPWRDGADSGERVVFLAEGTCRAATFVGDYGLFLRNLD